ncbi:RluA family pseudouridine synthase [Paraferrimonas sp. SM1919]|uniref:RluA family pseudouridine synthase n=1 Tax=Paraferrimonas sp. SM1919 TaxID=2662263 RepID=UPI0013D783A4|nr:RluA family pseudouridine synthase [Paraferrimonas sp. SM1919]
MTVLSNYLFPLGYNASDLPQKFTYPFYYQPHPSSILASEQLMQHLLIDPILSQEFTSGSPQSIGKMFGVLVVQDSQQRLYYLRAYSGKLAGSNHLAGFVPPVFDMLTQGSFFIEGQQYLQQLSAQISQATLCPSYIAATKAYAQAVEQYEQHLQQKREQMIAAKKIRKLKRQQVQQLGDPKQIKDVGIQMSRESVEAKKAFQLWQQAQQQQIAQQEKQLSQFSNQINQLKTQRKAFSNQLQQRLFDNYKFVDANGNYAAIDTLFKDSLTGKPPAGAGECAAVKLLQFAYLNQLKPIALAEFWWGQSPKSEIRRHKQYYPACIGKCKPILGHMLQGLAVDEDPLLTNPAEKKVLEYIYEDDHLVVVNKPAGLLSVPGKHIKDSVFNRVLAKFPNAEGAVLLHRLDMATSGIMILALTKSAHLHLQKQFLDRTIKKSYLAIVEGQVPTKSGEVNLPLRGDPDDRPRQLVCFDYGKPARSLYRVIEYQQQNTKLWLEPYTGRTHQLRMHCAHKLGLNTPIKGDSLYGLKSDRLYLHAHTLTITHPDSKQRITFEAKCEF